MEWRFRNRHLSNKLFFTFISLRIEEIRLNHMLKVSWNLKGHLLRGKSISRISKETLSELYLLMQEHCLPKRISVVTLLASTKSSSAQSIHQNSPVTNKTYPKPLESASSPPSVATIRSTKQSLASHPTIFWDPQE